MSVVKMNQLRLCCMKRKRRARILNDPGIADNPWITVSTWFHYRYIGVILLGSRSIILYFFKCLSSSWQLVSRYLVINCAWIINLSVTRPKTLICPADAPSAHILLLVGHISWNLSVLSTKKINEVSFIIKKGILLHAKLIFLILEILRRIFMKTWIYWLGSISCDTQVQVA